MCLHVLPERFGNLLQTCFRDAGRQSTFTGPNFLFFLPFVEFLLLDRHIFSSNGLRTGVFGIDCCLFLHKQLYFLYFRL